MSERPILPVTENANPRTEAALARLRKAMAEIEADIAAHHGVYPFNHGRVTQSELCRRADVKKATLQTPLHKDTTRVQILAWLDTVTAGLTITRDATREKVTAVADTLTEEVARLEAAAAGSRAKADQSQTELNRARQLLADNAIAQRDYDERASTARQAEAASRADQASLTAARLNLDWTSVRAPFDGRVGKAEVTEGNLVDGAQVLTTLVSASPVYVSFNGDESTYLQLGKLARSNPGALKVSVGLAHEDGFPHAGKLEFVDNQIDPQTGSLRLRAVVNNPDGVLTPGLFAKVKGQPLPGWAAEAGIGSWAQLFLKFAISHPAVTTVIPATSRPDRQLDQLKAGHTPLLSHAQQQALIEQFA